MENLIEQVRARRPLPGPAVCRAIRLAANVSQERLARELGVHRVTVVRWESGSRRPRGDLLARYVGLLEALQEEMRL